MGRFEDPLRKLEEMLVHEPTVQEYLDASNREGARALHKVAERLASYGFNSDYLFSSKDRQVLARDCTIFAPSCPAGVSPAWLERYAQLYFVVPPDYRAERYAWRCPGLRGPPHLKAVAILLSSPSVGLTCKPGPPGLGYAPFVPTSWMLARADEGSIAGAALPCCFPEVAAENSGRRRAKGEERG